MKKQTSNVANVNKTCNKSTAIVSEAKKHLNVRYVWGGTTPKGFRLQRIPKVRIRKRCRRHFPRTVSGIYKKGEKLPVYLETGFYLLSNKGYDIEMSYDE